MTDKETLTFNETLEQLDTVGNLKPGDRWPTFLSKTGIGWDWGTPLSKLARFAAIYIREQSKRISDLLRYNNEFEERARQAERVMKDLHRLRPADEWNEDDGDVMWWYVNDGKVMEAPWIGSPLCHGLAVEAHTTTRLITQLNQRHDPDPIVHRINVGGWPGYHTHWTPLPHTPLVEKSLK